MKDRDDNEITLGCKLRSCKFNDGPMITYHGGNVFKTDDNGTIILTQEKLKQSYWVKCEEAKSGLMSKLTLEKEDEQEV